jgi:hypothetical protein
VFTREARIVAAAKHAKALRRYQKEIERGASENAHGAFDYLGVTPSPLGYRWAPDRRLMMGILIARTSAAVVESSDEYQATLYGGAPSKYWEPGKSSNGNGTAGNPYQYSQLAANVAAGDVVGILPGFHEFTAAWGGGPLFDPGVNGTALSRVVYVGKYDPGTLGNPLTDSNRSEIGHTATTAAAYASYAPLFGWEARDYVTFDSLVGNTEHGRVRMDAGMVWVHDAVSPRMYRMYLRSHTLDLSEYSATHENGGLGYLSNYTPVWHRISTDLHFADCTFIGWRCTLGGTEQTTTNISALVLYSLLGGLIENNDITDCNQAFYPKGNETGAGYNYGTIRRNRVRDCGSGMRVQETSTTDNTDFYQNLMTGLSRHAITLRNAGVGGTCHKVRIFNNTFEVTGTDGSIINTGDGNISNGDIEYFENIAVLPADGGSFRDFSGSTMDLVRMRDNCDYRPSGTYSYQINSTTYSGIAAFQAGLSGQPADARENNSINANPNLHATTFRPTSGAPLTMGTASGLGGAGGEIGAYGGNPTIGRR